MGLLAYWKFQTPLACKQQALPFPHFSSQGPCSVILLGNQELPLPYLEISSALFKKFKDNSKKKKNREKEKKDSANGVAVLQEPA